MVERSIASGILGMTSMLKDRYLLKRLRAADQDALQYIYEKHLNDLLSLAIFLLSDISAAEDCLHDVFVRLVSDANNFKINSNLKGYLICCVANRAKDFLRKQARKPDYSLVSSGNTVTVDDPIARLIKDEQSAELFEALTQLPYQQREVFVLHVQGEMKFTRIAELLDVSVNTVRSRYRYAISKLQVLIEKGEL